MAILRGFWKTLLVAAIILYASLLRVPHFTLPPVDYGDKWVHLLAYALLSFTACWESKQSGLCGWRIILIAIGIPIIYGGIIEMLQAYWFYPRTGSWLDWIADCAGVLVGGGILLAYHTIRKNKA